MNNPDFPGGLRLSPKQPFIKQTLLAIFVVCLISYFPVFLHLEKWALRNWDEARLGTNACEMSINNNFLVTNYNGKPDMWNTQPPMMIWMQYVCIKIIGLRELAIRFPSALAALLTSLMIFSFCGSYMKNYFAGIAASAVLVTSLGYIEYHAARAGDYDSLLTFFTTGFLLSFYLLTETRMKKYIIFFGISLLCAILTKGVQPLFFLPLLLFYSLIYRKRTKHIYYNKTFYITLFLTFSIAVLYYILRERFNPGYINAVYELEVKSYFELVNSEKKVWFFYFMKLINSSFSYWYLFAIAGVIAGVSYKYARIRRIAVFLSITFFGYLMALSFSTSKKEWYDLPVYPLLAMTIALLLLPLCELIRRNNRFRYKQKILVPVIVLSLVCLAPYQEIIARVYSPDEQQMDFYRISYYLKEKSKYTASGNTYIICSEDFFNHSINFYTCMMEKSGHILMMRKCTNLVPGDRVIAFTPEVIRNIEENYSFQVLEKYFEIRTYKILAPVTTFQNIPKPLPM